jgi:predicted ATPase/DNA-binding winged helix-turn-helix (wHTH) protein
MEGVDLDLSFDEFRLDVERRVLWRAGEAVALGNRAFAILQALVERPNVLVTKAELFARVWPGLTVDDANLRVQVANLRKALGLAGKLIVTEQSIGYSFAGSVSHSDTPAPQAVSRRLAPPRRLEQFVGRESVLEEVATAMEDHRLVTIVGAGGIGKNSLAIEVARRADNRFPDGCCLVDLGLATQPEDVAAALATALERPNLGDVLADVLAFVRSRSLLIVLDCCERAVDAVADVAEALLAGAPGLSLLATSREALRVRGEFVQQLNGLSVPPPGGVGPATAGDYDAVALFAQAAAASASGFDLDGGNFELVGDICRRLDGIPLAVELAAGLVGALPIEEIRDGLDERFSVLTLGGRRGLPRHRTLDAAIAWSYDWLDRSEALALQRLSVFPTTFSLAGALQVIGFGELTPAAAKAAIVSLARKSLISVNGDGQAAQYRLLDTTRAFAWSRASIEDARQAHENHAAYVLARLEERSANVLQPGPRDGLVQLAADVRQALTWSYATAQDELLPVRISIAAETIWLELAQYAEHGGRMQQARGQLAMAGCNDRGLLAGVLTGLAHGVIYAAGDENRITVVLEAIACTEALGDTYRLMRNLSFAHYFYTIRHRSEARSYAERLMRVAELEQKQDVLSFSTLLAAVSDIQSGAWDRARSALARLRAERSDVTSHFLTIEFGFELTSFILFETATLDCFQGYVDDAFLGIDHALSLVSEGQHAQTRFQILYFGGCFLSFSCGDWIRARHYLDLLRVQARDLAAWQLMTEAYEGWMALAEGRLEEGTSVLRRFCASGMPVASLMATFQLALADGLRSLGDLDEAERLAMQVYGYRIGEDDVIMEGPSMRAQADVLSERGDDSSDRQALALYSRAIANARNGRALVFGITAGIGQARLLARRGDAEGARQVLQSTILEERPGQELPGMKIARSLYAQLATL